MSKHTINIFNVYIYNQLCYDFNKYLNGLIKYNGEMLFASHDHQFIETIANRIIEFDENGKITDKKCTYDEYLEFRKK